MDGPMSDSQWLSGGKGVQWTTPSHLLHWTEIDLSLQLIFQVYVEFEDIGHCWSLGLNLMEALLMQYRSPVGCGPSSNK